jgi:hypothetical protein
VCTEFQPSAAATRVGSEGRVAFVWHDTRDGHPEHVSMFGAWFRAGRPFQAEWATGSRITPITSPSPPCSQRGPGDVPFCYDYAASGDYDGMAADPTTGRFYAAWTDLRSLSAIEVWSASFDAN